MIKYIQTKDKNDCFGCRSCEQVCKSNALEMKADNEGFLYPILDESKCTNCGLCEKVCPIDNVQLNHESQNVFASWSNSENIRLKSSSGGLFSEIARFVLEKNGTVYGAAFDKEFRVHHKGVTMESQLHLLRSSKYVQSDTCSTFLEVKNKLLAGDWVYYTGTPCQIAGLKTFLRKDYETLVTSDLICHGTPSPKLFKEHIHYIERTKKSKVIDFSFRKNSGWSKCECVTYLNDSGKKSYYEISGSDFSPYLYAFNSGMVNRPVCYECPFSCTERIGDITLADYWGVKRFFPKMNVKKGVSLVISNSKKGNDILKKISSNLTLLDTNLENAMVENHNLHSKTIKPPIRNNIYNLLNTQSYSKLAVSVFRPKNYVLLKIKSVVVSILDSVGVKELLKRIYSKLSK